MQCVPHCVVKSFVGTGRIVFVASAASRIMPRLAKGATCRSAPLSTP